MLFENFEIISKEIINQLRDEKTNLKSIKNTQRQKI